MVIKYILNFDKIFYLPNHQAPSQRGSLLLITGVSDGLMYKLKQAKPKINPNAGPIVRRDSVIPRKWGKSIME